MGTLFAALGTATNAMDTLEKAIGIVQNNVANANTPGYVTQTLNFSARPFDPLANLWGGVEGSSVQSARNGFAEQAVWSASQQSGLATQQSTSLTALEGLFDVSGTNGIPDAISKLYAAFSSWSTNSTDSTSRQQVLTAAQGLSQAFNQAASGVVNLRAQTDQALSSTIDQINQYSAQIATINGEIRQGAGSDAGLQSQLYNTIEQLSNVAPVSVRFESDGTATVLLGGQSPLVIGQQQSALSLAYPADPSPTYPGTAPDVQLLSADGHDVTALTTQGQLGALLSFRNTTLPSVIGDTQQQGSLNQLAQGIADRANGLLTSGQVSAGPPAVPGVPLFSYAATPATSAAASLSVNSSINASQLAAIDPGPPAQANGIAAQLADMGNSQTAANLINGLTYTDFYSQTASQIGQQASSASAAQQVETQLLTQAQNLRAQVSGVSLNDQASQLLQFQQGYEAAAHVISVINNITQSLLQMMETLT